MSQIDHKKGPMSLFQTLVALNTKFLFTYFQA